jgi:hypothetical protein
MNKKFYITIIFVILLRILDFYTTHLAVIDFQNQEQNLLVKIFNLSFYQLFFIDIFLVTIFLYLYYLSIKNHFIFKIQADNLLNYSKRYFFDRININIIDLLFKAKLKKTFYIFGAIAPKFLIITSIIFSINNYFVYLSFKKHYKIANLYYFLDSFYFFHFIIFFLPIFILLYLLYIELNLNYVKYNRNINL